MPRLPTITAAAMIAFLESLGFEQVRQRGKYKFFRHPDKRTATVPDHKNEDSGRGITSKILRDAEVTREDFMNWYNRL